jgi:hypothetical protein
MSNYLINLRLFKVDDTVEQVEFLAENRAKAIESIYSLQKNPDVIAWEFLDKRDRHDNIEELKALGFEDHHLSKYKHSFIPTVYRKDFLTE